MVPLPIDVLLLVSSFLAQRDQLECMTVCRHWYDVIYHHSLFRDTYVYSREQLDKLLDKVKSNPQLGKKVERFTLRSQKLKNYSAKIIVEHFPNLRHLAIMNFYSVVPGTKSITPLESHPWCKHMVSIVEYLSYINTKTLLLSGLCKNLTCINVKGRTNESGLGFIEALVNAPNLKSLHLGQCTLSFHDLELLHKNAPLLDTLVLNHIFFSDLSIPHDIKPAPLVKRFHLLSANFGYGAFNPHFPYVSQKYIHLEQLTLELGQIDSPFDDLANAIERGSSQEELQHRERVRSYLQILAPHLKTLSLNLQGYNSDEYLDSVDFDFDLLDKFGFQLKKLELGKGINVDMLLPLVQTYQPRHIESLTIKELFESSPDWSYSLGLVSQFTYLKELTLGYNHSLEDDERGTIDWDDILYGICDTPIETLRIYQMELEYSSTTVEQFCLSLKTLALFNVELKAGADVIIGQVFPNLKNLTLNNCFQNRGTVMLPQTDLSYLDISGVVEENPFRVLVITMGNGEQRLYTTNKTPIVNEDGRNDDEHKVFLSPPFSSQPHMLLPYVPFVVVMCKSVYSVSLRNVIN